RRSARIREMSRAARPPRAAARSLASACRDVACRPPTAPARPRHEGCSFGAYHDANHASGGDGRGGAAPHRGPPRRGRGERAGGFVRGLPRSAPSPAARPLGCDLRRRGRPPPAAGGGPARRRAHALLAALGRDAPRAPGRSGMTLEPGTADASAQLLDGLRRGDDEAFTSLVHQHAGRMLATARRLLRSEDDAREAVQEAFVSAARSIRGFTGGSQLSTWLHRIVVNAALMKLRSRRRRAEEPIDELLPRFDAE